MSTDETKVLIGGRRFRKISQTKVFVEKEDTRQGSLRQRNNGKLTTSTSLNHDYTASNSSNPPPNYGNPNYLTPPPAKSPFTLQYRSTYDSGYYPSPVSRSYSSTPRVVAESSVWQTFNSPVVSLRNKFSRRGRANFFDDDRTGTWSINPQKFLGGLVFVTIFSSIGFAVLISMKHFGGEDGPAVPSNGKYQSLKFAAEKITSAGEAIGRENENGKNPFFDDKQDMEDPLFGVMNEIGKMDDILLAEKMSSDELQILMKASRIKIKTLDNEKPDKPEIINVDDLSEELLTTAPPVARLVVSHPTPTQASVDISRVTRDKVEIKKSFTEDALQISEDVMAPFSENAITSFNEATEDPACCPHKPKEFKPMVQIDSSPDRDISKSRKKTKLVNPLTKNALENKVSKAKKVVKIVENAESIIKDVDYPDLPTFRGNQKNEGEIASNLSVDESIEGLEATVIVDYPDDPATFRETITQEND